jgi:hypothetical protein
MGRLFFKRVLAKPIGSDGVSLTKKAITNFSRIL